MEQYISKSALVAEIKKLEKLFCYDNKTNSGLVAISIFENINNVIDTLKVKEVNLDDKIYDYINAHYSKGCDGGMISDAHNDIGGVTYSDLTTIAKHFYELGLKAQNIKKVETLIKDCTRNCSNYTGIINRETHECCYFPWITPDDARKAVEIAREELIEKVCSFIADNIGEYIDIRGYTGNTFIDIECDRFINNLKQAIKDE